MNHITRVTQQLTIPQTPFCCVNTLHPALISIQNILLLILFFISLATIFLLVTNNERRNYIEDFFKASALSGLVAGIVMTTGIIATNYFDLQWYPWFPFAMVAIYIASPLIIGYQITNKYFPNRWSVDWLVTSSSFLFLVFTIIAIQIALRIY